MQLTPSHDTAPKSILMLLTSLRLDLHVVSALRCQTKMLHVFITYFMLATTSAHRFLHFITWIVLCEEVKLSKHYY
jgi:hypothetical protein